ncbi:glycerol-3-phosphate dehydrogenase/oxidase [Lacibacter sp. MH-610]|uniref:glycerol-3-phosphate dehydrogenase/oxidase n=1 Tax=Lacibacter sp. MH-610 TaxID=3020883 RepID=UPI0038916D15
MNRSQQIQQLKSTHHWDIIIIGGGATGLGAAVDAAARGYKTLLVEQYDFGKGTSSRSTKLIHGGVRYLQQGNIRLVRDALKERGLLLKNAPHLAHPLKLVMPSYRWYETLYYGLGLKIYNFLSGKLSLGKSEMLSIKRTQNYIKGLDGKRLSGGVAYYDGQFDDARLCITLALTAADVSATVLNYAKVTGLIRENEKVKGVVIHDTINNETYEARGTIVVNATGVFVDDVLKMDDDGLEKAVSPSQGIHIVVDKKFFPGEQALFIPRTDDGRVLFAVPFHDKVIIGTTDTSIDHPTIEPVPQEEEVEFVINHFNRYVHTGLQRSDVKSVFAGLRPLIKIPGQKKTAVLPRDHTIWESKGGMINISGGKWTTYRKMAQEVILKSHYAGGLAYTRCQTETMKLHGWIKKPDYDDPLHYYGSDAAAIRYLQHQGYSQTIHPNLHYTIAEVMWAVGNEMAITVEDVLSRRTRALILDAKAAIEAAPLVADIMMKEMNKDEAWKEQQLKDFYKVAEGYVLK